MSETKCTCRIIWPDGKASLPAIEKCSLCKAAPDLLDACRNLIDAAVTDSDACPVCIHEVTDHVNGCPIETIANAIAQAEAQS